MGMENPKLALLVTFVWGSESITYDIEWIQSYVVEANSEVVVQARQDSVQYNTVSAFCYQISI